MRAHEIMENVSAPAQTMMMKMRKGGAAALNAKLLTEIIASLDGWQIENTKVLKPSDGGWVLSGTPFGEMVKKMYGNHGGKVYNTNEIKFYAEFKPVMAADDKFGGDYNERAKIAYAQMKEQVIPLLQANLSKKGRYEIRNVNVEEGKRGEYQRIEISFEFFVWCSAYVVTAPDGQTYEICGDYKNGALGATTFETFFKWAKENTDFMDRVLGILGMEPLEAKQDPRKPYTPPPGSSEETVRVFELLKTLTNDARANQKKDLIEFMNEKSAAYTALLKNKDDKESEARRKVMWDNYSYFLQHVVKDGKVNPGLTAALEAEAEQQVEAMQNMFVFKNTGKLSPILTAKGNLGEQKVVSVNTRQGIITAILLFTFDDGSSFRVDQSVVMSHTRDRWNNVTYFYRFPTTFHDVVMPDGSKMGYPSEERMNEVFAKG